MVAAHLANSSLDAVLGWTFDKCVDVTRRMDAVGPLLNPFYGSEEESMEATPANLAMIAGLMR